MITSVLLTLLQIPPPLPPLPPMWPGPVPSSDQHVVLEWADPVARLRDGDLVYQPPLLDALYPSVPDGWSGADPRTTDSSNHPAWAAEPTPPAPEPNPDALQPLQKK